MRLIVAGVQVKYFEGLARSLANAECFAAADAIQCAAETLRIAPTIDAEPVRHGRWVHDINNLYGCSECRARETMSHRNMKNYCPNCGAKMTEVQDD